MITVAVLLLPGLALLLLLMARLEDRLLAPGTRPRTARHARRHHLRLIRGGGEVTSERESRHIRAARPQRRNAA